MCRKSCIWRSPKLEHNQHKHISLFLSIYRSSSVNFSLSPYLPIFQSFLPLPLLTSPTSNKDPPLTACSDALQMFFSQDLCPLRTGKGHHVTIMCLTMLVFLGRSASLCLSAAAGSVPWGHQGWSERLHDLRLWVNSGRSWAQRCRIRFAVSWFEGPLWRAWMWSDSSSTNPVGWLGRVGTLVSH